MMKKLIIFISILMLLPVANAIEYRTGQNITLSLTNATDGTLQTGKTCDITISNTSGEQVSYSSMNDMGDGTYSWMITGLASFMTEKYTAKSNCTVNSNVWTTWMYFYLIDNNDVIVVPQEVSSVCKGDTFELSWNIHDERGAGVKSINSWDECILSSVNETGDHVVITGDWILEKVSGHEFSAVINSTTTTAGALGLNYHVDCDNINVTIDGNTFTTHLHNHFTLNRICEVWNGTLGTSDLTTSDLADINSSLANYSTISDLETHGDSTWSTATGFATTGQVASINDSLCNYSSISDLETHGDSTWATATGFATPSDLADINDSLATFTNITELKNQIDTVNDSLSTHSADDVWTVATRELTGISFNVSINQTAIDNIASGVWGYATRTLTSFGTLIADIWAYATRTLTGFEWNQTIADYVWNYGERNLTTGTWAEVPSFLNDTEQGLLLDINTTVTAGVVTYYDNSTMNIILPIDSI